MKIFLSLFGFLLIFGLANQVFAYTISNADFEDGLNGWTVSDSNGAIISTSVDSFGGTKNYTSPFDNNFAELTGTTSISQTISWDAGDRITFSWAFLGFDDLDDYAYYNIDGGDEIRLANILDQTIGGAVTVGAGGGHVGWLETTIEFSDAGSGLLVFGVADYNDELTGSYGGLYDSKLLVDMDVTAVPEPASLFLFGFGLLAIARLRRKL